MRAATRKKYCNPDAIELKSIALPTINKDNEVVIKIGASTVNRTDCANLRAKPFFMRFVLGLVRPRKQVLGTDFAGEIISVGKGVSLLKVGDRVFGFNDTGAESHAEFMTAKEENVFIIPDKIDYKQAAASLEGASYAYSVLHRVDIQSNQRILINGATGAIGSALLQFVRQYDVQITATCNSKNIELIRALGADKIYDYTKEDFTTDNEKYDFIFDAVGKSTFGKCKPLLKDKGIYISSELGPYGQNVFYPLLTILSNKKVIFPIPFSPQITIPFISDLLEKGKFKPVIDREYLLEDISEAYKYVLTGEKTGNVLIRMEYKE